MWLGQSTTVVGFLVAAVLGGVGTGLMTPAVNAAVGDLVAGDGPDADGGSALAGFQMVGDAGAVLGPVVAGVVVDRSDYPTAFATMTVVAVVSFAAWLRAAETAQDGHS
jgi:MFS family permease